MTGWGIDLDYRDIEWFSLEMNRDHSVVSQIASKYFILDSFVDHDGYSISSKGFLPTVVDIMVKVRRGGREKIPLVQGKRNPSKVVGVARGHQKADTLKPYSQKTSQSDHMEHSLVSLNETKPCHVGPPKTDGSRWRGLTERGPLEKGMANHFSILALRTP